MSKKFFVSLCVCCLVLGAVTLASAQRPKPAEKVAYEGLDNTPAEHTGPVIKKLDTPVQTKAPKSRVAGLIQYDDGVVTAIPGLSSFSFGNQFSTAAGSPVNANGSVTQLQFYMASGAGTDGVWVSVFGPVAGTTAPVLSSAFVSVIAGSATWSTHTFASPVTYTGASFLAGVWYLGGDSVGLGSGTSAGQGHHGMMINDVAGTGFSTLPGLNALVRAGGDVLVPVELMSFSVQ